LVPQGLGHAVRCLECAGKLSLSTNDACPIYRENLGQYQQHCCDCGVSVNAQAHPRWPELFGLVKVEVSCFQQMGDHLLETRRVRKPVNEAKAACDRFDNLFDHLKGTK